MVRDEMGTPLSLATARVFLETTNGVFIATPVSAQVQPGENYQLIVPMDSFAALDAYKPTALPTTIPFQLKVLIGQTVYLPIEMAGDFLSLGKPAGETVINLTLGVDSDGDGLPDAWENLLIQLLGGGLTLADIDPNGDNDGDGLSNRDEYIAGTYAFDPEDGLKLNLVQRSGQGPAVQFFGIADRLYVIQGTTNMVDWTPMPFRVPAGDNTASQLQQFRATDSQIIEAEVLLDPVKPPALFFRVQVY
jgi:hypothetical protein